MQPSDNILKTMRKHAEQIFTAGVRAVDPVTAMRKYCKIGNNQFQIGGKTYDLSRYANIYAIGCGKAAASMARALEEMLGDRITAGIVTVKYEHLADLRRISLVEAGHPVPDLNGWKGAERIIDLARTADKEDLVICLISGGGSALLPLPAPGLDLAQKQTTIKALLNCGASIHEINTIRKHTSAIKGGRLARAVYPAELVTLILSDVVGDDLDVIASGPCVPDASTFRDCLAVVDKYNLEEELPAAVLDQLQAGAAGKIPETPKHSDSVFARSHNRIIGSNTEAILSAKSEAERIGYNTFILSSMIEGDTDQVARIHGAIVREIAKTGHPLPSPACILSGGETTVVLRGNGLGGRNQEFSLVIASDIAGDDHIMVLSAGTDGTDGPTDAAGAYADNSTLARAAKLGLDPVKYLVNNDSYHFFEKLGDLLITGPTNTNVMDLRVLLVR